MTDISSDLGALTGERAAMERTLVDWCAINSGSDNAEGLATMLGVLDASFANLGADVQRVPSRPREVVTASGDVERRPVGSMLRVVQRPQAPVRVLLMGHMDTVFPADHTFQRCRRLDDDRMNGPGAADMKGGLLVMLKALETVERSRFAERIGYEVLINADEETGSHGSAEAIREAAARAHFACVYEPALPDGTLAGARKGSGNFSAVFRGRSAHAGREHHLGRNAIVAAATFAAQANALSGARDGLTVNIARIDGGSPNNVVPDLAVVRFNVRVSAPDDAVFARAALAAMVAGIGAGDGLTGVLHGGFSRPPKPMSPDLAAFFEALRGLGSELGLSIGWKPTGGCCDGNNIAAEGVPVIDTLGVRGGAIHSADEFVHLDSLEERAKLSALLLLRVAAGDIPNPGAARAQHGRGPDAQGG